VKGERREKEGQIEKEREGNGKQLSEGECRRGITGKIDRWVDRQADRMMKRGKGVAETEVEAGSYGPVQHFESHY